MSVEADLKLMESMTVIHRARASGIAPFLRSNKNESL